MSPVTHDPVAPWYDGRRDLASAWIPGAWDLCVRGLEPSDEYRLRELIAASVQAAQDGDAGALDMKTWRAVVRDLVVGIRAEESGGEAVRCRLTPVDILVATEQPRPFLPARLLTDGHLSAAVGALLTALHARHANRLAAIGDDAHSPPAGCEAVPTALGWLAVRPHTLSTLRGETAQGRGLAAALSTYLLRGADPMTLELSEPDLMAMTEDAASAVTHRWADGRWERCHLTTDPEGSDEAATEYAGLWVVQDLVAVHEVAARYLVAAGGFLEPWTQSSQALAAMSADGTPPFVVDDEQYEALDKPARLIARVAWSRAWAWERDSQISNHIGRA